MNRQTILLQVLRTVFKVAGRTFMTSTQTFALLLLFALTMNATADTPDSDHPSPANQASAETLWQEVFPSATELGAKDSQFPVWPVYQVGNLIGYLFESIDLIAIPGFSGEPVNLLVGIDIKGRFAGVKLLHHNEPIFLHGLGEAPLQDFIAQYQNLSATDNIKVGKRKTGSLVYVDGITKATASVVVINESILLSALKVAREKLEGFELVPAAQVREDIFEPLNWQSLLDRGHIRHLSLGFDTVENAFFDTAAEGLEDSLEDGYEAETGHLFIDLYFAYLNVPTVGRNLLGEEDYQRLMQTLNTGEQAIAVMSNGAYSFAGEDFIPASVPDRITIQQRELPIEIRDMNFYDYDTVHSPYLGAFNTYKIFRIKPQVEFDPGSPWQLQLLVTRSRGQFFEAVTARFPRDYQLPAEFFIYPEIKEERGYTAPWVIIWEGRTGEVVILLAALIILTVIILRQHQLTQHQKLFRWVRRGFLCFTLLFIGWYAQGQLSVVNILTLLQSLLNGFNIQDFLIDPILFILWIFVFASLFLWGRGIFCGWLCPFGVLQEITAWIANKLRIPQVKIPHRLHTQMWIIKYLVLGALVVISFYSLTTAEILSEVEPFKTAITLVFVRSWPFVLYAVVLLGISLFIHKFYCRYLCPLGAGLAVIGRLRRFEWLTRRRECGSPCQLCRHKCEIDAINPDGSIDYNECVQCLECIVYHNNDDLCPPQINSAKKQKRHTAIKAKTTVKKAPEFKGETIAVRLLD